MKILYIDTSIQGFAFAVVDLSSFKIIDQHVNTETKATSVLLSNSIKKVLSSNHIFIEDIFSVVVSVGPGSFTGIRMGLAWVDGYTAALATKIKVIGISSFLCLSDYIRANNTEESCIILKNSRKSGFLSSAMNSVEAPSLKIVSTEDCVEKFKGKTNYILYVDSSWTELLEELEENTINFVKVSKEWIAKQSFEAIMKKANLDFINSENDNFPQPLYLRKSSAEENLLKQKG